MPTDKFKNWPKGRLAEDLKTSLAYVDMGVEIMPNENEIESAESVTARIVLGNHNEVLNTVKLRDIAVARMCLSECKHISAEHKAIGLNRASDGIDIVATTIEAIIAKWEKELE